MNLSDTQKILIRALSAWHYTHGTTWRKNLHYVAAIADFLKLEGKNRTSSREVRYLVGQMDWTTMWDAHSAIDDHGLTRAIGDCLGGHGLQLKPGYEPGYWVLPKKTILDVNWDCEYEIQAAWSPSFKKSLSTT